VQAGAKVTPSQIRELAAKVGLPAKIGAHPGVHALCNLLAAGALRLEASDEARHTMRTEADHQAELIRASNKGYRAGMADGRALAAAQDVPREILDTSLMRIHLEHIRHCSARDLPSAHEAFFGFLGAEVPRAFAAASALCDTCHGKRTVCTGRSGLAEDGNAEIFEPCPECGYGEAKAPEFGYPSRQSPGNAEYDAEQEAPNRDARAMLDRLAAQRQPQDERLPEGIKPVDGIPATAMQAANALLCDLIGHREWDVPNTAKHMMAFAALTAREGEK
jgi:hypothetical protein